MKMMSLILFLLSRGVPGQAFLVEFDDGLGTLYIGLPGGHEVGFVAALPLDQEHQLPRWICGTFIKEPIKLTQTQTNNDLLK